MAPPPGEVTVRRIEADEARALLPDLAAILEDCVAGGASINFLLPFPRERAERWWSGTLAGIGTGEIRLFGAFAGDRLVGSAQLGLSFPENQPHRAEVKKVIVHREARGRGVATRLLAALDEEAARLGRDLLTLDTVTGSDADRLYRRCGWIAVGIIPDMALMPDGAPADATLFWKRLPRA